MKQVKQMKQQVQKGFTLIELMIVIAIIGILAAVAVPQYQVYTLKTTASTKGIAAVRPLQTAISLYAATNGGLPADWAALATVGFVNQSTGAEITAGTELATAGVTSVSWTSPDITVTFGGTGSTELDTKTLVIKAATNNVGAVTYSVDGASTVKAQYRPQIK